MIKVLVVDDHAMVRAGILQLLAQDISIKVVGEAESGEEAVKQVKALEPDVVLMDIKMPVMDGFEATTQIVRDNADVRVLVLTSVTSSVYTTRMLKAGASGYIVSTKELHIFKLILA